MTVEKQQQLEQTDMLAQETDALHSQEMKDALAQLGELDSKEEIRTSLALTDKFLNGYTQLKLKDSSVNFQSIKDIVASDGPDALFSKKTKENNPKNGERENQILAFRQLDAATQNLVKQTAIIQNQMQLVLQNVSNDPAIYKMYENTAKHYLGLTQIPPDPDANDQRYNPVFDANNALRESMHHDFYEAIPENEREAVLSAMSHQCDPVSKYILFGTGGLEKYAKQ